MIRLLCLAIGYLFGLFQTSYILGRVHGIDIREYGSHNAGTTNMLRTMGLKAGLLTFAGDCGKCILAVVLVRVVFGKTHADILPLLEFYAAAGTILGHNYPFYLHFKGGKGIACTGGLLIGFCPLAVPISLGIFILVVAITRYVSLGSILGVISLEIQIIVFGQMGLLSVPEQYLTEVYIVFGFVAGLAIILHHANIGRLLKGTENKFSFHSKKQEA